MKAVLVVIISLYSALSAEIEFSVKIPAFVHYQYEGTVQNKNWKQLELIIDPT